MRCGSTGQAEWTPQGLGFTDAPLRYSTEKQVGRLTVRGCERKDKT